MSARILLVEDDEDDAFFLKRAFEHERLDVKLTVAQDGVRALEMLSEKIREERPDLVILDLKLPRMNGLEVLRRIREAEVLRGLTVVIMTASDEERDRAEAARLGVELYLRKPAGTDELRRIARRLWALVESHPASHRRA